MAYERVLVSVGLVGAGLAAFGCAAILGDDFKVGPGTTPDGGLGLEVGADDSGETLDAPADVRPTLLLTCTTWARKGGHKSVMPLTAGGGNIGDGKLVNRLFLERAGEGQIRVVFSVSGTGGYQVVTLDADGKIRQQYARKEGQILAVQRTSNGVGMLSMDNVPVLPSGMANRLMMHELPNSDTGDGSKEVPTQLAPDNAINNNSVDGRFAEIGSHKFLYVVSSGVGSDPQPTKNKLQIGAAPLLLPTEVETTQDRFELGGSPLFNVSKTEVVSFITKKVAGKDGPSPIAVYTFPGDGLTAGTHLDLAGFELGFVIATARDISPGGTNYNVALGQLSEADQQGLALRVAQLGKDNLAMPKEAAFGQYPLKVADLPVNNGDSKWFGNEVFMIGASPLPNTTGLNFVYLDGHAGLRGISVGANKLLQERKNIVASAIDLESRPIASLVTFDVAWVEQDGNVGALWFDQLVCAEK